MTGWISSKVYRIVTGNLLTLHKKKQRQRILSGSEIWFLVDRLLLLLENRIVSARKGVCTSLRRRRTRWKDRRSMPKGSRRRSTENRHPHQSTSCCTGRMPFPLRVCSRRSGSLQGSHLRRILTTSISHTQPVYPAHFSWQCANLLGRPTLCPVVHHHQLYEIFSRISGTRSTVSMNNKWRSS